MDGCRVRWDGWMDGWMDGCRNRWIEGRIGWNDRS